MLNDKPYFLINPKWYTYEERLTANGLPFQRFELTNQASPEAIASFKETMLQLSRETTIDPEHLNRFQQALGFAAKKHYLSEEHGLSSDAIKAELRFISAAIRSYQLLDDSLSAPNTLIFRKRIATLYRQFLKQHPQSVVDENLNHWIIQQDQQLNQ